MTHRALPLSLVEAQARASRVAWPMTCNACNTGTPSDCDCMPVVIDRLPEDYDEPPREEMDGWAVSLLTVGVIVSAAFSAWFICSFGAQIEPVLVALLDVLP